jgi:hypothetical protein
MELPLLGRRAGRSGNVRKKGVRIEADERPDDVQWKMNILNGSPLRKQAAALWLRWQIAADLVGFATLGGCSASYAGKLIEGHSHGKRICKRNQADSYQDK